VNLRCVIRQYYLCLLFMNLIFANRISYLCFIRFCCTKILYYGMLKIIMFFGSHSPVFFFWWILFINLFGVMIVGSNYLWKITVNCYLKKKKSTFMILYTTLIFDTSSFGVCLRHMTPAIKSALCNWFAVIILIETWI
jgi:hypothetical protein